MDYREIISRINEKKRKGVSFYSDVVVLENCLDSTTTSSFVKAQLFLNLCQDYIYCKEDLGSKRTMAKAQAQIEHAFTEGIMTRENKKMLLATKTQILLCEVDASDNKYLSFVRIIKGARGGNDLLCRKKLFYYCIKNAAIQGFLPMAIDYAESAEDIRLLIEQACEDERPVPGDCIDKLQKVAEIAFGRCRDYARMGCFILKGGALAEKEWLDPASASVIDALLSEEEYLRFIFISLARRNDFKRIVSVIKRIEGAAHIFTPGTSVLVKSLKKFIFLGAGHAADAINISDIVEELSFYYTRKKRWGGIVDLHARYGGLVPDKDLFAALVKTGDIAAATAIYKQGIDPGNSILFEYLIKTDCEKAFEMVTEIEDPKAFVECIEIAYGRGDNALLKKILKLAVCRFKRMNGPLMIAILSMAHLGGILPSEQLGLIVLIDTSDLSENHKEWLSTVIYNNLIDIEDRGSEVALKALHMLARLARMDGELVHLILIVVDEQPAATVPFLTECYSRYKMECLDADSSKAQNLILFYEQFMRADEPAIASEIIASIPLQKLADDDLLLLLRKSRLPAAFGECMRRDIVTDSFMLSLVGDLLAVSPLCLYDFLLKIGSESMEKYKESIHFIESQLELISDVGDRRMIEFFRKIVGVI